MASCVVEFLSLWLSSQVYWLAEMFGLGLLDRQRCIAQETEAPRKYEL
jgi:hypothetical protein